MNTVKIGSSKVSKRDIQLWVNALRSGQYSQTRGHLQDADGYCCLGVACTLFISFEKQARHLDGYLIGILPESQYGAPDWLVDISKDFSDKTGPNLADLNDGEKRKYMTVDRHSFDEIADLLEAVYILEVLS